MRTTPRSALAVVAACLALPAAQAHADGQVIVKLRPGASPTLLEGVGTKVGTVTANGAAVLRVPGSAATAVRRLNALAAVQYAEVDRPIRALATSNDPLPLYGMQRISAPAGWDAFGLQAFPASGGVEVGIVDTGILASHPDLGTARVAHCAGTAPGVLGIVGGSTTPSESRGCADDNGHGTHVAGTIAATANNGQGVIGVAFNSTLSICKALHGALGTGSTAGVANCITYLADRGARVISMSLGGGASSTLRAAVDDAVGKDVLLVAAAGNDGDATANYPAAYANVVSVAATDQQDARASFSNANADVEIAAPGVDITSTWNDGAYATISGTSMATPHVAGAAALIRFKTPALTEAAARERLRTSVDDLGPAGRDTAFGFGRLNLLKAGA